MHPNEFDRLIADRFEEEDFLYKTGSWEKLSQQLPSKRPKVIAIGWTKIGGIAAGLAILIATSTYFLSSSESEQVLPAVATLEQKRAFAESSETMEQQQASVAGAEPAAYKGGHRQSGTALTQEFNRQPGVPGITEQGQLPVQEGKSTIAASDHGEVAVTEKEPSEGPSLVFEPREKPTQATDRPQMEMNTEQQYNGRFRLSVAGGMNFGSLNTGYAAGLNARQPISRKLFVEGDLAVVSNQGTEASMHPAMVPQFNSGTMAFKGGINTRETQFLYLQVNPSLGYQLTRRLSVSVGGDVQKLLQDDLASERSYMGPDGEARIIPDYDLGLTGRTEFTVNKRLKAGILYREGMNNTLLSGGEYLDRRYMQVQIKYTLINAK